MADEAKVYADGSPIQEYPKWVRDGDKEQLCNNKEEETTFLGKTKADDKPKSWDSPKK